MLNKYAEREREREILWRVYFTIFESWFRDSIIFYGNSNYIAGKHDGVSVEKIGYLQVLGVTV